MDSMIDVSISGSGKTSCPQQAQIYSVAHPPCYRMGQSNSCPGVKTAVPQVAHARPCSANVKMSGAISVRLLYALL